MACSNSIHSYLK